MITKADLDGEFANKTASTYKKCGFEVFVTSSEDGRGKRELLDYLRRTGKKDTIYAFSGASGAGKSTFINLLFPSLTLETGELSHKLERGKNTTRTTELFSLDSLLDKSDCGYLADTPGFSLIDFERFDFFEKDDLPLTMREFSNYIGLCKYTKCTHTKDEGCAIIEAVKRGDIPKTRHESFCELYDVLKAKKKW